jgi:secreted trypsin-like serine protease
MRLMRWVVLGGILFASCGVAEAVLAQDKVEAPFRRRIVGGEPTDIKIHPWQVALQFEGTFFCGGSIIAQKWILTAAHCFEDSSRSTDWRFKAGATDYSRAGGWFEPERIILHEDYKGKPTYENDIALVKLKVAPAGRVIPLASASITVPVGQPLEVTGWGATAEGGSGSNTLMKAIVPVVSNSECNAPGSYNGTIKDGMMCAGHREGGIDSCSGDSGGPLVWRTSDGPVLVGVVSFGYGCARQLKYGVYTRVNAFRDWIDRTTATYGN